MKTIKVKSSDLIKIKKLRQSKKMSQEWLAYMLNISKQTYIKIENRGWANINGTTSVNAKTLNKLCKILEIEEENLTKVKI